MLNGQKLQGTLTSSDVMTCITAAKCVEKFPLFAKIYRIAYEGVPVSDIVKLGEAAEHTHVPEP